MHPPDLIFTVIALLSALATSWLIVRFCGIPQNPGRYQSLDGLRGYLSLFVMFHHATIWFSFLQGKPWKMPESHLYAQFGQASVALFFMITGFLFFSKLLDSREKGIDWTRLYISRVLRITPLYLLTVFLLLSIILVETKSEVHQPLWQIARQILAWLSFTIFGSPDINGFKNTGFIVAGAIWTLRYEWLFYFFLPLLFAVIKGKTSRRYIVFSIIGILICQLSWQPSFRYLLQFAGGISAAYIVRNTRFAEHAHQLRFSILALLCLAGTVLFFQTSNRFIPTVLLSTAFTIMVCGNTLFGILTRPVSRHLGEISYSLYLLHGVVLYVAIHWCAGTAFLAASAPEVFWVVITASVPVLVMLSTLTFHCIEKPAMKATDHVTQHIRAFLCARQTKVAPPSAQTTKQTS